MQIQKDTPRTILTLLHDIHITTMEEEKISKAQYIQNFFYNLPQNLIQCRIIKFSCLEMQRQIQDGLKQYQQEILNIVEIIAMRGANQYQNEFFYLLSESGLTQKNTYIMHKVAKIEMNNNYYSDLLNLTVRIFCFIHQNYYIEQKEKEICGRIFQSQIFHLINRLNEYQKGYKNNETQEQNEKEIESLMINGAKNMNALEKFANHWHNRDFLISTGIHKYLIQLIHINCACCSCLHIKVSESSQELVGNVFRALISLLLFLHDDKMILFNQHSAIDHAISIIINSTNKQDNPNQISNSQINNKSNQIYTSALIFGTISFLYNLIDDRLIWNKKEIFDPKLRNSLITLTRFGRKKYYSKLQLEELARNIRLMCFQFLYQIRNYELKGQMIFQYVDRICIQAQVEALSIAGGSWEQYWEIIKYISQSLCTIVYKYHNENDKFHQIAYQKHSVKQFDEDFEVEGAVEEIEANIFQIQYYYNIGLIFEVKNLKQIMINSLLNHTNFREIS